MRQDVEVSKVQEHVYFQTYWKTIHGGTGVAVILYLYGIEAIKCDCLGEGLGHYHVNPNNPVPDDSGLIRLPEPTHLEQIERCIFELEHNLYHYTRRNVDERIRKLKFDKPQLDSTLKKVKARLYYLLASVQERAGPIELPLPKELS